VYIIAPIYQNVNQNVHSFALVTPVWHKYNMNKYTKTYNLLVESRVALNREFVKGCGYEKHHIVPKSLGGSDAKSNIVVLTPREHCIAHMLLAKMYSGAAKAKMINAINSMIKLRNKNRNSITSRQYELLRKIHYKSVMDPAYRAWRSEITKTQWTPERRAAVAAKAREQWANGPKRESFASNEYRTKKSQQMKERWKDPTYQKFISESALAQWQDPSKRPSR
jgi:hypothetical protein